MSAALQKDLFPCGLLPRIPLGLLISVGWWWFLFSHYVVSDSFAALWAVAHWAPLPMEFPREEHWSGLPFPSPGDLPDSGMEPMSPALAGGFFTTEHEDACTLLLF